MNALSLTAALLLASAPSFAAGTFADDLSARAEKDSASLKASKLAPAFQRDLGADLDGAMKDAGCSAAAGQGKYSCLKATNVAIQAANAKLTKFESDMAAAIKNDGTKSLAAIEKTKTDALKLKLAAAKMDSADKTKLQNLIDGFTAELARGQLAGGKPATVDNTDAAFQKLSDDVDAAIKLAAEADASKGFAAQFQARGAAVMAKIRGGKLPAAVASDFNRRFEAIQTKAGCVGAAGSPAARCGASPSLLAAADDALKQLSDEVDAAIKTDSGKTFAQVEQPKLDAIGKKLDGSKLSPADKGPLVRRLADLAASLKPSGTGAVGAVKVGSTAGASVLAAAEEKIRKLSDDVDATIALEAENGKAKSIGDAVIAKAAKLDAAIAASKLAAAFKQDFSSQEAAALRAAGCAASGGAQARCEASATASKLEALDQKLDAISAAVAAAIKADGAEGLSAIYASKAVALRTKLAGAKLDAGDRSRLDARLNNFLADLKNPSGAKKTPETAEAAFQAISDDLTAAIQMQADRAKKP